MKLRQQVPLYNYYKLYDIIYSVDPPKKRTRNTDKKNLANYRKTYGDLGLYANDQLIAKTPEDFIPADHVMEIEMFDFLLENFQNQDIGFKYKDFIKIHKFILILRNLIY